MMHPDIEFPGALAPLLERLSEPCHGERLRDPQRRAVAGSEVDVSRGLCLIVEDDAIGRDPAFALLRQDLDRFMTKVLDAPGLDAGGFPVRLRRGPVAEPAGTEDVDLRVDAAGCHMAASGLAGIRRGLFLLEDEMQLRRAPVLPVGEFQRRYVVRDRITRSPVAPYRWLSGWELESDGDFYPEAYLSRLAHAGVNGLWVAALLRNLVPSRVLPELGPPEPRLERLNELIRRAALYGIRVFVFCIEPRGLPASHPALAAHPEISSSRGTLCTSVPLVREYVRDAVARLFAEAPGLAGLINLFNGERYTTCWSKTGAAAQCPRCGSRVLADGLAEDLDAFAAGIRDSSPSARLLAWTYMMDSAAQSLRSLPIDPMLEVMERSDPTIVWLGNFEHGGRKTVAGRSIGVHEYALSYTGPSESFARLAEAGRQLGRTVYAKLQIGTSYEVSSVPYLPAPPVVYDKLAACQALGVGGAMLGWIPGGFPSLMLKAAGEAAAQPLAERRSFLTRLAGLACGEMAAGTAVDAYEGYARALAGYPVDNHVLYFSPVTRAPAYLLHLEREPDTAKPYNFGLTRSRREQPFEDQPERWSGEFTVAELIQCFRGMAQGFAEASSRLASVVTALAAREARDDVAVGTALAAQFAATADVIEFYAARNALRTVAGAEQGRLLDAMLAAARDHRQQATTVLRCQAAQPFIGYHSEIYAYSYSPAAIRRAIRHVEQLLPILTRWRAGGVDPAVLDRTTEAALTPDRPDLMGD